MLIILQRVMRRRKKKNNNNYNSFEKKKTLKVIKKKKKKLIARYTYIRDDRRQRFALSLSGSNFERFSFVKRELAAFYPSLISSFQFAVYTSLSFWC